MTQPAPRAVLALPAGVSLLVGMDAGLTLLGVWAPVSSGRWGDSHAILMVFGFVGTLIAVERAVALGRPAGYLPAALLGAGSLSLIPSGGGWLAALLIPAGQAGLCLVYVPLWRRQRDDAVLISALGAVLGLGAAVLWRGGVEIAAVMPWLAGFVILTIAGERLELARLAMPAGAGRTLVALAAAISLAVPALTLWPPVGAALVGAGLVALTGWLGRHDVARRTVRGTGLPRYIACCMLAGQAWLGVAGAVWLVARPVREGAAYDAVVHAVFLGFTLSMIMAHAPTILPAVTRVSLPYHPVMYVAWALLQVSLLLRLWLGDALGIALARQVGGAGNALAVLVFIGIAVASAGRTEPARLRPGAVVS